MTSEAQKNSGYPIPEEWQTEDTASYCIIIPAGEEFRKAAYSQLLLLGKWWKWKHNEASTRAKESAETWRLLFEFNEDCGGGFLMTPEEYYEAHKAATYDAWNDIAKQIVSGRTTGFVVGADGTVTDPSSGVEDVELPEDDPATEFDETRAANYGGTIAICRAIELFFDKADTYYGAVNGTPAVTQVDMAIYLQAYFPVLDAPLYDGLTSYYSYRSTNAQLNLNFTSANQLFIYCHGSDQAAFNQWLIDSSGFPLTKINTMLKMILGLAPEFYSKYMADGATKPSTAYVDGDCVPMKYQEYTGLLYGTLRNLLPTVGKGGHRLYIEVEGYYSDPDGDLQDAFWYRTAAGTLARSNFTFTYGAGANMPSDNQVPYSTTHAYAYTIDLPVGNNSWSVQFNRNAGMNVISSSPTSGFTIKITDLGQYTL